MTKKVLVSLDELREIIRTCVNFECGYIIEENVIISFNSQPEAPQWISVEERLPEEEVYVIALKFTGDWKRAETFNGRWFDDSEAGLHGITHWMPIPPLPDRENKCDKCCASVCYPLIEMGDKKYCRVCYADIGGLYHDFNADE